MKGNGQSALMSRVMTYVNNNVKWITWSAVLLVVLLGFHLLRSQLSQLDDDLVHDYYQQHINATRQLDARAICAMLDTRYHAVDVTRTPRGEERVELNRRQACDATRESMVMLKKVLLLTREEPDIQYKIETVDFSPDRRQATVKLNASIRIGKKVSVTIIGTETLVRRLGTVLSLGSNTQTNLKMSAR